MSIAEHVTVEVLTLLTDYFQSYKLTMGGTQMNFIKNEELLSNSYFLP